jgi:hypothetical protein
MNLEGAVFAAFEQPKLFTEDLEGLQVTARLEIVSRHKSAQLARCHLSFG